jgi:hypothetical protein
MKTGLSERPGKRSYKWIIVVGVIIALAVLLTPVQRRRKDGGTVEYKSLIYNVIKLHALEGGSADGDPMIRVGTVIELFGKEIYNETRLEKLEQNR